MTEGTVRKVFGFKSVAGIIKTAVLSGVLGYSLTASAAINTSFSYRTVIDPYINVPIMKVFLPEGWRVNVTSDWQRCSSASIAFGIVSLISPDGNTEIIFTTPEAYAWSTTVITRQQKAPMAVNKVGCNFPKRIFNHPYLSSKDYIKTIIPSWGMSIAQTMNVNMTKEDSGFKKMMIPRITSSVQQAVNMQVAASRGTFVSGKVSATYANIDALQLLVTLKNGARRYSEHIAATLGYTTTLQGRQVTRQLPPMVNHNTLWKGELISYYAPSVEAFNANYDIFKTVVNNSRYLPEWGYLVDYYGQRMAVAVMQGTIAGMRQFDAQSAQQALREATEEQRTADQSQMTEAMSDTIYERNDYTDHEGNHFKVSTGYDVYRDQDNKYHIVTEGRSVPDSYTKLKPNEARDYPR